MPNQEEQNKANKQEEQDAVNSKSQHGSDDKSNPGGSSKPDPIHNTGNDRMMIDEEGVEIGPDDEV